MKLMLDHTQRVNLHALLGAQRTDVGSIRAIWNVQDRIALDADEEKAVELKREMVAGQERVLWNPALSIPAKEFEFTDGEAHGLRPRLEPGMGTAWPPTAAGWNPSYTLCLARSESGSSQRPGRLRIELRNRT